MNRPAATSCWKWAAALAASLPGAALAQEAPVPHVGYVYPAGGQQGTMLHIIAGGQQLRSANRAFVSGAGVHATVVRFVPMMRRLEREQLPEARDRLFALRKDPRADSVPIKAVEKPAPAATAPTAPGNPPAPPAPAPAPPSEKREAAKPPSSDKPAAPATPAAKPNAPAEVAIGELSLRELECYLNIVRTFDKRQNNAQLAEGVLIEIQIDPGAVPGERELRLAGPNGLSNPIRFEVGNLPEVCEQEPIGRETAEIAPSLVLPCTVNGQVMPGDRDGFRFQAKRGQHVVIDAHARRLIPYLADAVPGWFEPVVALYDAGGRELAFADDFAVNPDPTLLFQVPADGEYRLQMSDALFRGREDFVYRVTIGELPFITQIFPLGGRVGTNSTTTATGWNLAGRQAVLDTSAEGGAIRTTHLLKNKWSSNQVPYAVDDLPESTEAPPADAAEPAMTVLPRIVNGRVGKVGEIDTYRVEGRAGQQLVAEVVARRLNSRLDSRLTVSDPSGKVLASNDDMEEPATGLLTYNADSYLRVTLPGDGVYSVQVTDACGQGGSDYGYRLRLSAPQPGFELRITPSTINLAPGRYVPLTVHALRKDGFDGEIEVTLVGAPGGVTLQGARIPGGQDRVRFTICAQVDPTGLPFPLNFEGRARIEGREVARPAVPADDMMQAFMYRHLVPSQESLAFIVGGRGRAQTVAAAEFGLAKVPIGGSAEVRLKVAPRALTQDSELALSEPPAGLTLETIKDASGGLTLLIKADEKNARSGLKGNLIVAAYRNAAPRPGVAAPAVRQARALIGYLPAIPFEIVNP